MEHKCTICNKDFETSNGLEQHNLAKHPERNSKKINFKSFFIPVALVLIVVLSTLSVYSYKTTPGEYDGFAKCLTEKGVVVYGNDFCSYTGKQLNFFGKSKKHLNYVRCSGNKELCDSKGVEITPTWEINEKPYSGVQTFETLARLTGCEL